MPVLTFARDFTRHNARQWLTGRLTWIRAARTQAELERVYEAGRHDLDDLLESGFITALEKDRLARLMRNARQYRAAEEQREVAA